MYLASIIIPVIVLLKNSVDFHSVAFLASFYLIYIYVVVGFVSLLIIRTLFYSEENDLLGRVGWLTLFFLGIIGMDILPILKVSFITIVTVVLFVFSLFVLQNQLALSLKSPKRLEAGKIWQVSVSFRKKKIFQNMLTFYNIVEKKEMDTRCDSFYGCSF